MVRLFCLRPRIDSASLFLGKHWEGSGSPVARLRPEPIAPTH